MNYAPYFNRVVLLGHVRGMYDVRPVDSRSNFPNSDSSNTNLTGVKVSAGVSAHVDTRALSLTLSMSRYLEFGD